MPQMTQQTPPLLLFSLFFCRGVSCFTTYLTLGPWHRVDPSDKKAWDSFVDSVRAKLTVKQVVDGVRGGATLSFDYVTLILTAE